MKKNWHYIALAFLLVIAVSTAVYIRVAQVPPEQVAATSVEKNSTKTNVAESSVPASGADETQAMAAKIDQLEQQIQQLTEHAQSVNDKLAEQNQAAETTAETSPEINQENSENLMQAEEGMAATSESQSIDSSNFNPGSVKEIDRQDELQNAYLSQLDSIYAQDQYDNVWSAQTETGSLEVLTDLNKFAQYSGNDGQATQVPLSGLPDVSVSRFNCRTNMCETEFQTGSMEELIAYQNFMVEELSTSLPSIFFSPVQKVGGKFQMRAFLAKGDLPQADRVQ